MNQCSYRYVRGRMKGKQCVHLAVKDGFCNNCLGRRSSSLVIIQTYFIGNGDLLKTSLINISNDGILMNIVNEYENYSYYRDIISIHFGWIDKITLLPHLIEKIFLIKCMQDGGLMDVRKQFFIPELDIKHYNT